MSLLLHGVVLGLESGRAPRVLVIGHASALQDVVALKKTNPDFDWRTCPVAGCLLDTTASTISQYAFYWVDFEKSVQAVEQDLLTALELSPEVIVMTDLPSWDKYPVSVRKNILKQVEDGAVFSVFVLRDSLRREIQEKMRPLSQAEAVPFVKTSPKDPFKLTVYSYGKGRILVQPGYLDHRRGFAAPDVKSPGELEYWMARYGQVLRNALGVRAPGNACQRDCWLNEQGHEIQNPAQQPSGRYFLIQKSFDRDGRLTSAAGRVVLNQPETGIDRLERISPMMRCSGDDLTVKAVWRQRSSGGVARLDLRDAHGRIYLTRFFPGTPAEMTVRIPASSTSVYNTARISYFQGNRPAESAEIVFTLPEKRRREPFYLLTWNTSFPDTARQAVYFRLLKEQGIDGFTHMGVWKDAMCQLAGHDLLFVPYTAAFHWSTIPGLMDRKKQQERLAKVRKAARIGREFGILAHSLGDENYVSAFTEKGILWDDPIFWKGFQKYLQGRYGTLEKLNKKWRRAFASWSDIRFHNEKEMFSFDKPGAWVDCRQYVSSLFIGEQEVLAKAVREIDPHAFVGWDGGEQYSSYDGYDFYPYVSSFNMSNVYARSFMNKMLPNKIFNGYCMRSFAPEGALLGLWMNGVSYPDELYLTPYMALFSGIRSIWWWHAVFTEEEVTPLRHDLTPGIPFRETARAVREIKNGPAPLLERARPEEPRIAIYYSAVNFHASSLSARLGNHVNNLGCHEVQWNQCPAEKMSECYPGQKKMWMQGKAAGHYAVAFKSFMNLIKDLNLDARVIDGRQIEKGGLNQYRILVLPFVEALSDAESQAIRTFVKNGGCIIGDYRTGVRDEVCNFRNQGALDDIFGIEQKAPFMVEYRPQNVVVHSFMADGAMGCRLPVSFSQPQLKLKGGGAWGRTDSGLPAFIFHKFGNGTALYLNCDFYQYFEMRRQKKEADLTAYWRTMMIRYLGFPQWQPVRSTEYAAVGSLNVFRYRENRARYVALVPERQLNEPAENIDALVPMGISGHLYDVMKGKYLGFGEKAEVGLTRGKPALLAVLPEKAEAPKVTGTAELYAGENAEFEISGGRGTHTLRVQVFAPDGRLCSFYGGFVHTEGKAFRYKIPTALNDQTGIWRLQVTELVSGQSSCWQWKLNAR